LARDASHINIADTPENQKKLKKIQNMLAKLSGHPLALAETDSSLDLKKIQRRVNLERERFEHECLQLLDDIEENKNPSETNLLEISGPSSIVMKA